MYIDPLYLEAQALYAELRQIAFDRAVNRAVARGIGTSATAITSITPRALQAYAAAWAGRGHWTGDGGWPWDVIARPYLKKPRAFHAALWEGDVLCGLAVGTVSRGKERITLRFMQSSPHAAHPLRGRVTLLMFEAATAYGEVLGSKQLILRDPLDGAVSIYRRLGFEIAGNRRGVVYLARKLA